MTDLGDFESYDRENAGDEASGEAVPADDESAADAEDDGFERPSLSDVATGEGIGTLAASQGLRISEEDGETGISAYVTTDNRRDIRLGKYVLADYPDGESLFCRIAALEYGHRFGGDDANEIHARRAMREDSTVQEDDYRFVADLDPVAVIYEDGGELKRRAPDRVPKPETVVRDARDTQQIKTALKIPEDGVFLGHLAVGGEKVRTAATPPTIDYRVKDDYEAGDPLVFRHTLVAGGTGSGKTHTAKNFLRQYLHEDRTYEMEDGRDARMAVVQFDPQDEYAQMHDDNPDAGQEETRRWEAQGLAHGGHDDTKAFVPKVGGASYNASHHRAEQVEFTIPFSMVRGNPWLVAGSGLNENQYNALVHELIPRFFKSYGDDAEYDEFLTFLDDPALKEELDESGRVHEATFEALVRRVRGFGNIFDQDARPITDQIRDFVRPGGLSVVPTYHINDSRATEVVVLALSSLLVDQKLSNDPFYPRIKETPLLIGMDEAHNFLTDADTEQAKKVIGKFTEAAKQGRKERLGLFLVTQDPQDIADPVFKQVNTTVVLNLGDEDAIKSVNIPSNLEGKVPYMEKGQMVVYSPDNSDPVEIVGLPTCLTRHGRD